MTTPLRPSPGTEDKLRDIRAITDAALSRLDGEDFLAELLARVRESFGADTAAVLLLDRSARHLIATAAAGLEEEVRQGVRVPVGQGFAGRVAAEKKPVILNRVDQSNVVNPILVERKIRSLLGVPLLADGAVIGVLHVGSVGNRVFTADDVALLQVAAERAALSVQSLRTRDDRAAAAALQKSLLPSELPTVPGVEIATRYVPGDGMVGGDWYDRFTLPSGELCTVMGDVAGHGLDAAVIMGRMRSALRAYALETSDPAEVLAKLDRKMQHFEPGAMATVSYAMLDPATGRLRIASAGHLPPVVAVPGQAAVLAEIAVGVPIGVADSPPRQTTILPLSSGSVVALYTDGLVERRTVSIDDRLDLLRRTVAPGTPENVCISVMLALVGNEQARDDIAVLVMRWQPAGR